MPELPEVETVKRGLTPVLKDHFLKKIIIRRKGLRRPFPENLQERLEGRRVIDIRRRAKYLLLDLEDEESLMIHLGMSGRFIIGGKGQDKHDHFIMETEENRSVVFNDARRFGHIDLYPTLCLDDHPLLKFLGPEPLDQNFEGRGLWKKLREKHSPIKSALLDQHLIAGLGNIYVCEALFETQISPLRLANTIKKPEANRLLDAIRNILTEAIASGGSSLRDHRQPNGELGYFQQSFKVYDRENQPCLFDKCQGTIKRIRQAGRSSFYCPNHQK
jgi:formamidopyrimidine-DNA glycosylase